jgi:exopolyphosphatase/guanosine-5'-triphosphate,3'-diphosphate pyrophosphatase
LSKVLYQAFNDKCIPGRECFNFLVKPRPSLSNQVTEVGGGMVLWAAIDVGTNSVRLLVARIQNGKVIPVYRQIDSTRLGEGLYQDGWLKSPAIRRTVDAVTSFVQESNCLGVTGLAIVATSAARVAQNGTELSQVILHETGCPLEILSGNQEAKLSFWGATSALDWIDNGVVLDIGGGSTELVFQEQGQGITSISKEIGAVRCTEQKSGYEEIWDLLQPSLAHLAARPQLNMVGVGGTITSLAAMEQEMATYDPDRVHGYLLRRKAVKNWRQRLEKMPIADRRQIKGLQPARADIIPAGLIILEVVMDSLRLEHLIVSEADLLEGLILRMAGLFVL